jgi:WXXGXW repeat (2 copies)
MNNRLSVRSLLILISIALVLITISTTSFGQIGVSITIGPPALPVYEQPPCPSEGYLWTPGYWAYDYDAGDYYWVPGTWVEPPQVGFLWTPAYWGWGGDRFIFHEGYWGPHVGFYGGIAYGYGYFGEGYEGGRWDNGRFFYNRSVNNINVVNIHNVYNTTIVHTTVVNRVSYNGGNGGINARPRPEDEIAERDRHIGAVAAQTEHIQAARNDRQLRASVNQGRPPVAATARPGAFSGGGTVPAREAGAPYNAGRNNGPRPPTEARDLQPHSRPNAPNTGNPKLDQRYQQQQNKLYQKQEQDHQKLQQQQEREHQQLAQRNADDARKQQLEQRHTQQTQQMEQRHEQQSQKLESRQQPRGQSEPGREKH